MKQFVYLGLVILAFVQCKKNETNNDNTVTIGTISGKVILPWGSTINPTTLQVQSVLKNSQVQSDTLYEVSAYTSEPSTLFVSTDTSRTLMMGYRLPGSNNNDITVTSTALGLVMNTLSVLSLPTDAKTDFLNKVQLDSHFPAVVEAVRNSVIANRDLFGSQNTDLFKKVDTLMTSVAKRNSSSMFDAVLYSQQGTSLSFFNDGTRTFSSVVGIYKNGQRLDIDINHVKSDYIVVEGIPLFPGSWKDLLSGNFRAATTKPEIIPYVLTANGQYDIKVRTGLPNSTADINSGEFRKAFCYNMQHVSQSLIERFLPEFKGKFACLSFIAVDVYNHYQLNNYYTTLDLIYETIGTTLKNIKDIENCANGSANLYNASYFPPLKRLFQRMDLLFLPASAANTTLFTLQWSATKPTFDTCYTVSNNVVSQCGCSIKVGDSYAGGIVMYVDNNCHGYVVSSTDLSSSSGIAWYQNAGTYLNYTPITTNASGTGIGSGKDNTDKIVAVMGNNGNNAASLCRKYSGGGYTDWFLPSKDELNLLYTNRAVIGIPSTDEYWTSSESIQNGKSYPMLQNFQNNTQYSSYQYTNGRVRAIRAF